MNTKTTKFLAVLAVLAVAFAAFAVIIPVQDNDATNNSAVAGDYTFYAPETAEISVSGNTITYSGYFANNTVAYNVTSTSVASIWGSTLNYYAAVAVKLGTANAVKIEQTNYALKEAYPSGVAGDPSWDSPGLVISDNKETRYYAAGTFGPGGDGCVAFLVPQNNSNVTITITEKDATTGVEESVTYTLVFKDSASTRITLATDPITPGTASKWNYAVSTSKVLTFTDSVTSNVSFYSEEASVSYVITAGKTVSLIANDPAGVLYMKGATQTLKSGTDGTAANLNLKQLNPNSYGLYADKALTVGGTSTSTTAADIFIKTTGGSTGMYVKGGLTIHTADLDLTAGEKGLNIKLGITATYYNNIVLKIDGTMNKNNSGTDSIFGLKLGAQELTTTNVPFAISAQTKIVTDGFLIDKNTGTFSVTMDGIVVVKGGYTQTDYSRAYGVAGIVNRGGIASMEATLISSESEATTPKKYYVVDGADTYGVTVKNTGGTTVQKTDSTDGATASETALITEIAGKVANCTGATITLSSTAVTSLDVSKLMENTTISSLESLTLIKDKTTTITASKDISVTNTKLTFVGFDAVSGNFTNGTNSVQLSSVSGTFGVYAGSVHIDGNIKSGNVYIDGDADISGQLTGTLNLFKKTDATYAKLEILDAFSIKGGILNINDVAVTVDTQIKLIDAGTIAFKTGATFDSAVEVAHSGTGSGAVKSDVVFTKNLTLSGTSITIGSAITTSNALNLSATVVSSGFNITANGNLNIADGTTLAVTGTSETDVKAVSVSGDATIAGNVGLTYATLTLSGTTELSGNILYSDAKSVIKNSGTMTVTADGKTYKNGGDFAESTATLGAGNFVNNGVLVIKGVVVDLTNNKTVRLYKYIGYVETDNAVAKHGKLVNNGTIYIMDAAADIRTSSTTGTGTIDTSAVSEEFTISGSIITAGTTFSKYQIVTFTADTTVKEGADITFAGNAIIPEGVTVTIENGALMTMDGAFGKLTNNGKIAVEGIGTNGVFYVNGSEVINNGTIIAEYSGNVAGKAIEFADKSKVTNNGDIIINDKNTLANATANFINAKTGTIAVYGDMTGTDAKPVVNSGAAIIASESNPAITISNAAAGASVTITEAKGKIIVNDAAFLNPASTTFQNGANSVTTEKGADNGTGNTDASATYGGIVISSTTYKYSKTETATALAISGALTANSTLTDPYNVDLTIKSGNKYGTVGVTDALTLSEVDLIITNADTTFSELYVSGIVGIDDTCTITNNGTLTVPGTMSSLVAFPTTGTINAAEYDIPANATLGTKKTYVLTNVPDAVAGAVLAEVKTVTVTGEVEIDESITVPAGMTLRINDAKVTIKEDAAVLIAYDGVTPAVLNSTGAITVEGKLVIEDVTKSKKGSGTIASEVVLKSGNTETYTTLAWAMADVGTEEATLTLCGATIIKKNTTIPENITVDTNGNDFTVSDAELTIDGALFLNGGTYTVTGDNGKIVLNGAITKESKMDYTDGKAYPAGLYFHMNDSALYVIGNIADAEEWAVLADSNSMTYYGDLKTSDIDFDVAGTLVFKGKVDAVSMDIGSKAKVTFEKDVAIDAVAMGVSTVTIKEGAYLDANFVSSVGTISFNETQALADSSIAVAGDVATMTLAGKIGNFLSLAEYQVATLGDVTVKADLVELTVGPGTTTIGKNSEIVYLEVYGDLVVDNGFKLKSFDADVYGTLTANAATDSKAKATAEITGLSVGVAFDYTSAAAAVYGDVTADVALVGVGATVPETISGMNYYTDVYVEVTEVLTAYASTSSVPILALLKYVDFDISDPNAKGPVWYDEDGDKVLTTATIGDYEAIYAVYDYNVYSVTIVTDAGVKSVAIGGIELVNTGGNVFSLGTAEDPLTPLTAGTYKVTYTLKSGYEGTAVLSTETGTILKDNSFTIMPGNESKALNFQLAGTEPTPEPEPEPTPTPEEKSEWTVTTILLCVLVVLIAIMAVIVALRLNRN